MFFIGCPMWSNKEWVGNFFPIRTPASDFLRLYSRNLNTVEGNTTFYALPSSATIVRWCQETPPSFRFCPKVSRTISHDMQLESSRNETVQFITRMRELGVRLGPIFLQLPPSFGPVHLAQLEAFLDFWPSDVRLAVEVRHPDFYTEQHTQQLNTLLTIHNTARVLMDTRPIRTGSSQEQQLLQARERKPNLPLHITATTDFVFLRYIGHPHMEVNTTFLTVWAEQIGQWLTQEKTVYVFCHCPFEKYSPAICATLYQQVTTRVPLPPVPVAPETNGADVQQQRLF